ncbi:hypothetical protein BH24GEM1_BH24GEM1_16510 [soil metagenome]
MMNDIPPLRKVTASVLTPLGWLRGVFQVPAPQSLVDFLASGSPIVKFTKVRLPGAAEAIPFVALRRDSVSVIEPTTQDEQVEPLGSMGRTAPHDVACLFPSGVLRGTLEVLVNVRVSDFLRQQASLVVLRRCVFAPHNEPLNSPQARKLLIAVVNMAATVGVAEWENLRVG